MLLLGISKSGFGAGFGSLAVPMMALAISVPQAAAVLMPVLLLMDLLGMAAFRKDFDKELLKFLVPCGLIGTVIGALLFKVLNAHLVAGMVGAFTLLFLAQRLLFPPRPDSRAPPKWLGALLTITSGFTSFIAHAGGPPINAYVIPLRLSPVKFTATMAFLFFVINLSKWIPYASLGLLDARNKSTSLVLLPLAPLGGVDRRARGQAHQPDAVLPAAIWRHVFDRLQIAVGRLCLNDSQRPAAILTH